MQQDQILQRAFDRLREIADERRKLEDFISTYRNLAGVQPQAPQPLAPALGTAKKPASADELANATLALISERGTPIRLGDAYSVLTARGYVIGGKEPRNNLGAKLSADKRLRSVQGHGWWFANEPLPWERTVSQLQEFDAYEEGPDTDVSEPLHLNGSDAFAGH